MQVHCITQTNKHTHCIWSKLTIRFTQGTGQAVDPTDECLYIGFTNKKIQATDNDEVSIYWQVALRPSLTQHRYVSTYTDSYTMMVSVVGKSIQRTLPDHSEHGVDSKEAAARTVFADNDNRQRFSGFDPGGVMPKSIRPI